MLAESAQRMLDIIKMEYPDIYTALQQYEKGLEPSTFSFIADMDEKSLQLEEIDGVSYPLLSANQDKKSLQLATIDGASYCSL